LENRLENILPFDPARSYPICIGGKRTGPPEHCVGAWAYLEWRDQYVFHPPLEDLSLLAKRSGSLSETQDALGHRHASTTRVYVESIAVKTDKYSQHILEALELPDFEIDVSSDSGADQKTNDKAVV